MIHIEPLESRRLYDAGNLDTSFGDNGIVTRTSGAEGRAEGARLNVGPQGEVVLAALVDKRISDNSGEASISVWRMRGGRSTQFSFGFVWGVPIPPAPDVTNTYGGVV